MEPAPGAGQVVGNAWRYLLLLCLSRQLSHLVCPGMGSLEQLWHWPASFLSCRTFFARSRRSSFRSDCWFLACSYTRRASRCSSGVLLGVGAFRGFSFLGFFLGPGLVISKRCWKVLSSVRGWGRRQTVPSPGLCLGLVLRRAMAGPGPHASAG